jgi:hypothetical protein
LCGKQAAIITEIGAFTNVKSKKNNADTSRILSVIPASQALLVPRLKRVEKRTLLKQKYSGQ